MIEKVSFDLKKDMEIPGGIDSKLEECISPVCFALWAWDQLNLEMGEASIIAGSNKFSNIFAQVAVWHGAIPCIHIGKQVKQIDGIEYIEVNLNDPEETVKFLRDKIKHKPGIAVLDLSGQPELISILLEHLPRWGRIMFAAPVTKPLTMDYYNNVHRSGTHILSTIFDASVAFRQMTKLPLSLHFERALSIVQSREMGRKLLQISQG